MYALEDEFPCGICTNIADSLNGSAKHVSQRINIFATATGDPLRIKKFADSRNWNNVKYLISKNKINYKFNLTIFNNN